MRYIDSSMQWYVYTLRYPDNTVFYVGKGKGNRVNQHTTRALNLTEISYKSAKIIDLYLHGEQVQEVIEAWFRIQQHAYVYEAMLIEAYGIDNLVNRSKGTSKRLLDVYSKAEIRLSEEPVKEYDLDLYAFNQIIKETKSNMSFKEKVRTTTLQIVGMDVFQERYFTEEKASQVLNNLNRFRSERGLPAFRYYYEVGFSLAE